MNQKQLKIRKKGQNSVTNFQLSFLRSPETPIKPGFHTSATIEWE